jgi:hypothetical protein
VRLGGLRNPYPLGTALTLNRPGWRLRVNSAILDANAQVEAVTDQNGDLVNPPPQVGWQYALVNLTVTNEGLGAGSPAYFFQGPSLDPPGIGLVENTPGGTTSIVRGAPEQTCVAPPLDLNTPNPLDPNASNQVAPGESETGNLCFEIGSPHASTTLLYALSGVHEYFSTQWFALH